MQGAPAGGWSQPEVWGFAVASAGLLLTIAQLVWSYYQSKAADAEQKAYRDRLLALLERMAGRVVEKAPKRDIDDPRGGGGWMPEPEKLPEDERLQLDDLLEAKTAAKTPLRRFSLYAAFGAAQVFFYGTIIYFLLKDLLFSF